MIFVLPIKVYHDSAAGPTGHVLDLVRLQSGLDVPEQGEEGDHHEDVVTAVKACMTAY